MKIGIFDSGRGGEFVAEKLRTLLTEHEFVVINDLANAPYGEKPYDEIRELTEAAILPLLNDCKIIVLACNTATAASIDYLRTKYRDHIFIGFEPMIKVAAKISETKRITLLATYATSHSQRTEALIAKYAEDFRIDIVPTFGWASAIDVGYSDDINLSEVARSVASGSDAIIIGCTHYIKLIPRLAQITPSTIILEPTEYVAREINRQAARLQR